MSDVPEEMPANSFLASMPWWVVLGRDDVGSDSPGSDSPGFLVLDADGSTCLAIFTDEDLAQRFVRDVEFDGGPLTVETPEQFWQLARRLPAICTYAAFDPPARVGGRARWVVPMAEVLRAVAAAQEEANGDNAAGG